MFNNILKHPKTSVLGVGIALLFTIASIWAPPQYKEKIHDTAIAIAASGLFVARDPSNAS